MSVGAGPMCSDAEDQGDELDPAGRRRAERFRKLEWLRKRTKRKGGRKCMHPLPEFETVGVGATSKGAAHVEGVQRCASTWACPVCAPTIGETRAKEIDAAASAWIAAGGRIWFVTATLSHSHGDDLGSLLDMLQGAWSRVWRWGGGVSPPWYAGMVRAVEVTYGANGWHPHIRAAVFIEPGWDDCAEDIRRELVDARHQWGESVHLYGGTTSVTFETSPGWDVSKVNGSADVSGLASYLTKIEGGWGLGLELSRLDLKRGGSGATPAVLLELAVNGDAHCAVLYALYERATNGRRRIVSSPGLCLAVASS